MNDQIGDNESAASGFVVDGYEGVTNGFTQITHLSDSGTHVLSRAKRHGRWYLLKSLSADVSNQTVYQEMLSKEFDITMRLQHPNVVQAVNIEDVASLGRCIVLEWIDGVNMKEWLEKGPDLIERLKAFDQLLDSVAYLHDVGIVHRDLKPANIMITAVGHNVKIIDFSLADTESHAEFKQPAGTEGYISPEQAQSAIPDVRNDIYSLGIILKEMRLGRKYDQIANKCLLPVNKRWSSVNELRAALKTKQERARIWIILATALAAIILFVLMERGNPIARKSNEFHKEKGSPAAVTNKPKVILEIESTTPINKQAPNNIHRKSKSSKPTKTKPTDPILPEERQPAAARSNQGHLVGDAISDAANELNYALHKYLIEHRPDTLQDIKYLKLDYAQMKKEGYSEIDRIINRIHGQFNKQEIDYIRQVLTKECDEYVNWIAELVKSRNK